MLRGDAIGLRARSEHDAVVLHSQLYDDIVTQARSSPDPWRPIPPDAGWSPFAISEPRPDSALFSVVRLDDQSLVGAASLWGIDLHNRTAHIGVSVLPAHRGLGYASDIVRVVCRFGFAVRGLNRLQIETMADNEPMLRAARGSGFVVEGRLRQSAWVCGAFGDEVVLGLLAGDWVAAGGCPS